MSGGPTTIHAHLKRQAIRWSALGLVLTIVVALPAALNMGMKASERQTATIARSAAHAFRRQILDGHIRDAQYQMRGAFQLGDGESIRVLDPAFKPLYETETSRLSGPCSEVGHFCWSTGFKSISYLQPIYFDEELKDSLFGYLEVQLSPVFDISLIALFLIAICAVFFVQAAGLASALIPLGKRVTQQLEDWAIHLTQSPDQALPAQTQTPFADLGKLHRSVEGLHLEIRRLETLSATRAKSEAQLSILKELGHDLKTPLSQLAKLIAIQTNTVRSTGALNEEIGVHIDRTMARMGGIVRQVRGVSHGSSAEQPYALLDQETKLFLEDLKLDPEVSQRAVKMRIANSIATPGKRVNISPVSLHRILENLVRNSVQSVSDRGEVILSLEERNGMPTLIVQDNGSGIPKDIQNKIFDFDFTTKPSRGTGLGLGIVKKLCNDVGAELSFSSEVGKGTTFQVAFQPYNMEC